MNDGLWVWAMARVAPRCWARSVKDGDGREDPVPNSWHFEVTRVRNSR